MDPTIFQLIVSLLHEFPGGMPGVLVFGVIVFLAPQALMIGFGIQVAKLIQSYPDKLEKIGNDCHTTQEQFRKTLVDINSAYLMSLKENTLEWKTTVDTLRTEIRDDRRAIFDELRRVAS